MRPLALVGAARMIGLPVTHLLAAAAGGIVAASIAWSAQGLRYDARIADLRSAHAQAAQAAAEQAQAITTTLQKTKDDAIQQAQDRAKQNALAAAAARRTADSLREQLASAHGDLASATHAACTEYARTASDLLGACAARYTDLAAAADGHLADSRLMRDAWPVAPEK